MEYFLFLINIPSSKGPAGRGWINVYEEGNGQSKTATMCDDELLCCVLYYWYMKNGQVSKRTGREVVWEQTFQSLRSVVRSWEVSEWDSWWCLVWKWIQAV